MKSITLTVEVDGNEVSRSYALNTTVDFGLEVDSMLDTITKSTEQKF